MKDKIENILKNINKLGEVSASIVQRKFQIGYSRAALFIDILKENGVIDKQDKTLSKKILDKKQFMILGKRYFTNLFKFYDYENHNNILTQFSSVKEYVSIAEKLITNDYFAKTIDKVLLSKFSKVKSLEERVENFRILVYGNYSRSEIVALITNDFISKVMREDLNYKLDAFWLARVRKYKSFLEDNSNESNENN